MPADDTPNSPMPGAQRAPVCGATASPEAVPASHFLPQDFRSSQFGTDAQTLVRTSGQTMEQCRQALFIAEGDMAMAHQILVSGYGPEPDAPTLH